MGDSRFDRAYEKVEEADDKAGAIVRLGDEEVIHALASASRHQDPYLANVLATEAVNRQQRAAARGAAISLGAVTALSLIVLAIMAFALHPRNWRDEVILVAVILSIGLGGAGAAWAYVRTRRRRLAA